MDGTVVGLGGGVEFGRDGGDDFVAYDGSAFASEGAAEIVYWGGFWGIFFILTEKKRNNNIH